MQVLLKEIKPKLILPLPWFLMFLKFQIWISCSKIDHLLFCLSFKGRMADTLYIDCISQSTHQPTCWNNMRKDTLPWSCELLISLNFCWFLLLNHTADLEKVWNIIFNLDACSMSFKKSKQTTLWYCIVRWKVLEVDNLKPKVIPKWYNIAVCFIIMSCKHFYLSTCTRFTS